MGSTRYHQEPVAIVGFAGRLPGGNNNPQELWEFLQQGSIAANTVPRNRFHVDSYHDGSCKPGTMRSPGGMFIDADLDRFDASFFETSRTEAIAMDPNQRQMLEVVYEALENAGIPLERLSGTSTACYVGSFATDYRDMQSRDIEDRPPECTIGVGRAIMANRLSYFLNIKGPSVTIDTACSGSLVGLDFACRSLQSGESEIAIITASNLFIVPDHLMDTGVVGMVHSPTGLCHTFDDNADGYVKAESVNCVIVKTLAAAIRDRDPIRALIRGTASNSNGRTRGIVSPSDDEQAAAIRRAYANAGITDLAETTYLECHGTGTQAGDAAEVIGISKVFAESRDRDQLLHIGSIKGNIGHAEPAAGINGLMKVVLSMEKGIIPGCPTFVTPSTKIDFAGSKVKLSQTASPWPYVGGAIRRASVNSFGYGGSNAHAILEQPSIEERSNYVSSYRDSDSEYDHEITEDNGTFVLVLSANDLPTLQKNITLLCNHLISPRIELAICDLAYTLSERRSSLWHRAFVASDTMELQEKDFTIGVKAAQPPRIGLVFTGQGAQWPQMGKDLVQLCPWTRSILRELDQVLQSLTDPPVWSIEGELTEPRTAEHLRDPFLSQPLVTAMQLVVLAVFELWHVDFRTVIGHSSGEIAAAYAAGFLDRAGAIKAAFYRGQAAQRCRSQTEPHLGMLAVGLGAKAVLPFIERYPGGVWIACFNSSESVTLSGKSGALETIAKDIKVRGHFARLLQVDVAYHCELIKTISDDYSNLLSGDPQFKPLNGSSGITMFSSVTAGPMKTAPDASYWKANMNSPVRFDEALTEMIKAERPDILIEVGPAAILAGPISQILKSFPDALTLPYQASWARGANARKSLLGVAGRLFNMGAAIDMSLVNQYAERSPQTIVDLPNYSWNHSSRYWHENAASAEWRHKRFIHHDLIGSKIPGTSWEAPTWRKNLNIADVPWMRDHKMGPNILMPGAGFIAIAVEAMYQKHCALSSDQNVTSANEFAYHFRHITFDRALVLEDGKVTVIMLTLSTSLRSMGWHDFRIRSVAGNVTYEHCNGSVRIQDGIAKEEILTDTELVPLRYPQPPTLWYKVQREVGMNFGPAFQLLKSIEAVSGRRHSRAVVDMTPPASGWSPQSHYPLHPAVLDNFIQTGSIANAEGERGMIQSIMLPSYIGDLFVNRISHDVDEGLSFAESKYTGNGRKDVPENWMANITAHDSSRGSLIMICSGLKYIKLDAEDKSDPHVLHTLAWKPDISLLTQRQIQYLASMDGAPHALDMIIDLVANYMPALCVLEINLGADASSLWFSGDNAIARAAYSRCDLAFEDAADLVSAQTAHSCRRDTNFYLAVPAVEKLGLGDIPAMYDLAIMKTSRRTDLKTNSLFDNLWPLLKSNAFVVVVESSEPTDVNPMVSPLKWTGASDFAPPNCPQIECTSSPPGNAFLRAADSRLVHNTYDVTSNTSDQVCVAKSAISPWSECAVSTVRGTGGITASLYSNALRNTAFVSPGRLIVSSMQETPPKLPQKLATELQGAGWEFIMVPFDESNLADKRKLRSVILVLDDPQGSILARSTEAQWNKLKNFIGLHIPLLWITEGAQGSHVTNPDGALIHGLFRTIRREDPESELITLDVQDMTNASASWAIRQIMNRIVERNLSETEYLERDGIIHVSRIMPDVHVNNFKAFENGETQLTRDNSFHDSEMLVRLQAEKLGNLQSLVWSEAHTGAVSVQEGWVEIEIMAAGVNFKDVVVIMGILPGDEHTLGCECAGYIRRLGPSVTKFRIGDRVCASMNGSYANRVQCPEDRVHGIPEWMSFEDAASVPLVYLTALYALYYMGSLKEGQSVLIHSAAGGVGLAAIQLAKLKKAEIFATVGTDEKRDYLCKSHDIPLNRIYSSRNVAFAREIEQATGGYGCDLILNSLSGEFLDESWKLTADGGIMIEIGKRDIAEHSNLSMEPFHRNCAFRGLDLSNTQHMTHKKIGSLLAEIFDLLESGAIKPIEPLALYEAKQIIPALVCLRGGNHIGKIVVRCKDENLRLPIKPALRRLELDRNAAYVIVGGLRGLCGSVAVHLARHGARNLVVISRSGVMNEASARVIENCKSYGCQVVDAKGDVGDTDFVRRALKSLSPMRIAGIIHGAMVLRDKPYETMAHDDYNTVLHAKYLGTWNLHRIMQEDQTEPLDFFTMLSSISGIIGNKGQANYAAANTFLDAFASFRKGRGLRANAVDLGVVEDVGYLSEQNSTYGTRLDKSQSEPINETMLRKIVNYSIFQQQEVPLNSSSGAQLITGIAHPLRTGDSGLIGDSRFAYLLGGGSNEVTAKAANEGDEVENFIKIMQVLHASEAETSAIVKAAVDVLRTKLTSLLRLDKELEQDRPLMTYGLDSLSAVEMRTWLRQKLEVELSTLDIANATSLNDLCEKVTLRLPKAQK
ncbi:MAG: hypothetical protein MMC23_009766 [Stictis urceolatum]|nr:hypothetical protein [Stictis urceolata]